MTFKFVPIPELPGPIVIEGYRHNDERGFFSESFRTNQFETMGIPQFIQENHSRSAAITIRGLHYQLNPVSQGKLIYCARGAILDVMVDIRKYSPFYGKWASVLLNDENCKMVYIPSGFAHGFLVKDGIADIIYKATAYYSPSFDRSILWNDPDINIDWGLDENQMGSLNISKRDEVAPQLKDAENNFYYYFNKK
jgi:dTDP-4-dehydrorhamnose 3,5-epimerase